MAAMKVTISAAMRARDVSRPHAEHLASAEMAEARAAGSRPAAPADGPAAGDAAGGTQPPVPADAGGADTARLGVGGAAFGDAEGRSAATEPEWSPAHADGGRGRSGGIRRRRRTRGSPGRGRSSS
jgi:hypothetical protein